MSRLVLYTVLTLAWAATSSRGQTDSYKCNQLRDIFPDCACSTPTLNGQPTHKPIVDCSGKGLEAVPQPVGSGSVPHTIHQLLLNNNSITSLPARAFANIPVTEIDLRGNALSLVDPDAFAGGTQPLHKLHLQGNGTNFPPKAAFTQLGDLEELTLVEWYTPFLNHDEMEGEPYNVFAPLRRLARLTLHTCQLRGMEPYALEGPSNLQELSLINNELKGFLVDGIRDKTTLVKLTISGHTEASTLTLRAFDTLTNLQTLDLSNNGINTIEEDALLGLGNLKTLIISYNNLDSSSLAGLSTLPNLGTLDLSHNSHITSVPTLGSLATSQPLALHLQHCAITRLGANALSALSNSLASLDLSHNRLSTLDDAAFLEMPQLRSVSLASQSQTSQLQVPRSLGQTGLTHLDLSGQPVQADSLWRVVRQLTSLQVLDLSSTDTTSIPDLALQGLTQLQELKLASNLLTELNQKGLVGPRDTLKLLILSGNPLQTLPPCLLHQYRLPPAMQISLEPNSLRCDCSSVGWLINYRAQGKIIFTAPPLCNGNPLWEELSCTQQTYDCPDYYQVPSTTATPGRPQLSLSVDKVNPDKLRITWAIQTTPDLKGFIVRVTDQSEQIVHKNNALGPDDRSDQTSSLELEIFRVCVTPDYADILKPVCQTYDLTSGTVVTPRPLTDDDDDDPNVGIIVGTVIAGVVLLLLLVAIGYLVFLRRKPKGPVEQPRTGVQPRTYTKQELPEMAKGSMQVVAISDGMAHNGSGPGRPTDATDSNSASSDGQARVGRAHLLTSEGSTYKSMSDLGSTTYENDRGPLPKPPRSGKGPQPTLAATHAYYNAGFNAKYDEISPNEISF